MQRHAFISYVKEDVSKAIELQEALEAAGIAVWRDKDKLWPGMDWEVEIRKAIQSGTFAFIACFSEQTAAREASYQNEELILATEEYRKRKPGVQWLFPVRFAEVELPEYNLGAGRTLNSLQFSDLFGSGQMVSLMRLTGSLSSLLSPQATQGTASSLFASSPDSSSLEQQLKFLLRDPNADIALEELVMSQARAVRAQLEDEALFPVSMPKGNQSTNGDWARHIQSTLVNYEMVMEPLAKILALAGQYGLPAHEPIWTEAVNLVASTVFKGSGNTGLLASRGYPLLYAMYLAGLTATWKNNWGTFRAVAIDTKVRHHNGKSSSVYWTNARNVMEDARSLYSAATLAIENGTEVTDELADQYQSRRIGGRHTPLSDHLGNLLWDRFSDRFADRQTFDDIFDRFEAMCDAVAADINTQSGSYSGRSWLGAGSYTWRTNYNRDLAEVLLRDEADAAGTAWKPLLSQVFGGDADRASVALTSLVDIIQRIRSEQRFS